MDNDATLMRSPDAPLRRLAQYELLRQVGAGAMGIVYHARDSDLDRRVAIKLLAGSEAMRDADAVERFLREARTAAQIVHPNVAIVYQVGRDGGETFIAMEWIEGTDLAAWVEQHGPMPWTDALHAIGDALAGLSAAHAVGLVHRDVKPSNLMRTAEGRVKVVDFGLARWHGLSTQLTLAGGVMGTPAFMSPEQCCGEEATPASDLYALGCSLYYLLVGRLPFDAGNLAAVMRLHIEAPMPDPRAAVPGVPDAVAAIVQRLTVKDPSERPDAATLLAALRSVLAGGAAAKVPRAPRGHVPDDATSFIGREALVQRSLAMLAEARLVTLVGTGGTGKTRLSQQAARRAAATLGDGAWFVELATVPAGHAVEPTIAAALGVPEVAGRAIGEAVVERLRGREMLLVLDNCEQVVDAAAAFTARLLGAAPQVRVLATSRQPLGVPGEEVLPVPPLEVPPAEASPAKLHEAESIRLFAARARAVRPDFALGNDNAAAVAQICRRLDGIPLAIELAAARVKVLTPAQISARLDDAFKLLVGGQRVLQQRQQTLRALFDWSFDLLDERERLLFARLAVFRGDFDLEAAEAVVADGRLDAVDVLDALTELVDRSLVIAAETSGTMRYRLLQTTQQYAAERLGHGDDALVLARRHAAHYTQLAVAAAGRLNGKEHAAAMAALNREADNARAALDAATRHRWHDAGLPLAAALAAYWQAQGVGIDGVARIERLLEAAPPPPSAELALLLERAGALAIHIERRALAGRWLQQGLAIARELHDASLEAELLRTLGNLAYRESDMDRATRHYLESVQAGRHSGNRAAEALAYHNLAAVAGEQRLYEMARGYLQRTLQIAREIGAQRNEAESLRNLALVEFDIGHDDEAQSLFEAGMRIHRALGDDWGSAYTLWQVGRCKLSRGDTAGARDVLRAALDSARRFDDRPMVENLLDLLALASARDGDHDRAVVLASESLGMRRDSEASEGVAFSLVTFAELYAERDAALAARLLGAAEALRTRLGAPLQARKQLAVDTLTAAVRERLGGKPFDDAYAAGAAAELQPLIDAATRRG